MSLHMPWNPGPLAKCRFHEGEILGSYFSELGLH